MTFDTSPIWISFKTGAVTIVITFFLGILAARWVVTRKSDTLKAVMDGIFTLPLVLPPTVMGFLLLCIFGVKRPVGMFFARVFDFRIAFSWAATVIAAVVISFPLMYRAVRGAFEQVDSELINAGRTLGMSENRIFWKVMIPNSIPGIVSGGVIAYARGLGEFGATAMLAGNIAGKTRTLPLAVYSEVAAGRMDTAGRYVLIIVAICFIAVMGMNIYQSVMKRRQSS